jgi:regulator of RNase E activity RraA
VAYTDAVPTMTPEEYSEWVGWYYSEVCPYPWMGEIEEGDFIVIDAGGVDAGLMGSENTLGGIRRGARGYVTEGGVRDTDEVILQEVPFWSSRISQAMVQARLQFEAKDIAVEVGGVTVNPGDVVVADGDGVIVVPRQAALAVAEQATDVLRRDMAARRKHYDALGREPDDTVA